MSAVDERRDLPASDESPAEGLRGDAIRDTKELVPGEDIESETAAARTSLSARAAGPAERRFALTPSVALSVAR